MKIAIKTAHQIAPCHLSFSDFIKTLFNLCGEVVINDVRKVIDQEVTNDKTNVGWNEFSFLRTHFFGELVCADRSALKD
jgi:hypothetical protein